jgi:hypothetical protein
MMRGKLVQYRFAPLRYRACTRRPKRPVRSVIFLSEGARDDAGVFYREETYGFEQAS